MMFPGPKLNTLFASRWKALAWGAGVLLTAYCSIPSREESDRDDTAAHTTTQTTNTSPWAPDPKPVTPPRNTRPKKFSRFGNKPARQPFMAATF